MTTRLPQHRYIGDGVYAGHDGYQFTLETCNGDQVTNRIALDNTTIAGLKSYLVYAQAFYDDDQHRVAPGCEGCQKDITNLDSPIAGAIQGQVYHVEHEDAHHEIRLCQDCSTTVDQEFLTDLIQKRQTQNDEQDH